MPAASATTWEPFLKEFYDEHKVENYAVVDAPFFNLIPRKTDLTGEVWKVPIKAANPQGVSNTFASAKLAGEAAGTVGKAFLIEWVTKYGLVKIENTLIEQTKSNKGAFLDALDDLYKGTFEEMGRAFETDLFSDGYASIGVVASISTNTFTLATTDDAYRFQIGMLVEFAASRASGAKRAGYGEVSGVNLDTGVITLTANVTTAITSAAAADVIFRHGDRHATAASKLAVVGVGGFIPTTDPVAAENFFGVDRSSHTVAYAGSRFALAGGVGMRESLNKCLTLGGKRGIRTTHVLCGWGRYEQLRNELADKVVYTEIETDTDVLIKGIKLTNVSKGGEVAIVPSWACPETVMYGINRDVWALGSVNGETIKPALRGGQWLDYSDADAIQARYRFYGAVACRQPSQNWVGVFA